jgi:hypothetical protein
MSVETEATRWSSIHSSSNNDKASAKEPNDSGNTKHEGQTNAKKELKHTSAQQSRQQHRRTMRVETRILPIR